MVLVRRWVYSRQYGYMELAILRREYTLIPEVVHSLVGVVPQERLNILCPPKINVNILGVLNFVLIQFEKKLYCILLVAVCDLRYHTRRTLLMLVPNIIAMDRFIFDDESNDVRRVGNLPEG